MKRILAPVYLASIVWASLTLVSMTRLPAQTSKDAVPADTDSTPTLKAGTEEVVLDVIARDKKGNPVTGLKPGDLEVYDNGSKRKITSFRLIEGNQETELGRTAETKASAPAVSVAKPLNPLQQVRLVTLIFNRLDLDARQLARTAALDLLKTAFPQNVYMSVWVLGENIEAIQPFTNNRELLHKAVEHATSGAYSEYISDSARIQQQLQQLLGPNTSGDSVGEQLGGFSTGGGGSGAAGKPDSGLEADQAMAQMMYNTLLLTRSTELAQTGRAAIWGLISAVEQQFRLPGRKSILLFSSGFGVPQGMEEPFQTLISTANRFNVTFYSIDARGLNTKSLNQEAVSELRDASSASRANFRKGNGLVTPAMANAMDTAINAGKANTQDTLAQLAESTGGFLIANTNDFRGPLRKVTEDIETYYEVTYNPGIESYDGTFRKVELKTALPGVHLQSRAGYFALPASVSAGGPVLAPYELPLLQALNAHPSPHAFGYQSTGLHFRGSGTQSTCNIVLDVPLSNLTLQEDKTAARFQGDLAYVALVKTAKGDVVRKFRNDIPLASTADQVSAFRDGHFIHAEHFELPPGRYTLETALLDRQTGQTSVRKSAFFMPTPDRKLGISSIAIVRSLRENGAEAAGDDPFLMAGKTVTPTLSPVIKRDSAPGTSFYFVVYPDSSNTKKPQLSMQFNRDGRPLGAGSPALGEPDLQGRIPYVATAPTGKLEPGNYQVRFVVTQGEEAAEESVTFTLQ